MGRKGDPSVTWLLVRFLRASRQWSQARLAEASRVAQSDVSSYERGKKVPSGEVLARMAAAVGIPWPAVEQVRRVFAAVQGLAARGEPGTGQSSATPSGLEGILLALSPYLLDRVQEDWEPEPPGAEEARREAREVSAGLLRFPPLKRRRLAAASLAEPGDWALVESLCHESEHRAAHDAPEALDLAELALLLAGQGAETEPGRQRLQGYAWAYIGNARRVANAHEGAREAFARAWDLWRAEASSPADDLAEWRLFDLEASLRREERRFAEALELLDQARAASGGGEAAGRILLKKASTLEQMGDSETSLAVLEEAAPLLQPTAPAG